MGKLGVGVGDDFPIDDGSGPASGSQNDPDYEKRREEWRRQRDEWQRSRDEWRDRRREWRDAWRKKKGEFREEMRARYAAPTSWTMQV